MADEPLSLERGERRQNFRVAESVLLSFEPIEADCVEQRWQTLHAETLPDAFSLSSRLLELRQQSTVLRRHAQQESSTFARLYDQLDQKLDLISEVLMLQSFGQRKPALHDVDLGAEGMGLTVARPLTAGAWLDLRMVFRSTGAGLRTLAEVLRCEPADGGFRVGLKFRFINDFDSELMVHQVLTRQSKILREKNNRDWSD
jgi:hypothetical protein